MTTVAQLRKAALALPEAEEGTHFKMLAFKVRGTGFASVTKEGIVQLSMSAEDADAAIERFASAERLTRNRKPIGLRVPLSDVNGMELNSLVEKAWSSVAPKRLVAARREAAKGQAPPGPDALPASIGKPATQALLAAGVRSLKDVARRSKAELLALHGFGPKAARLLEAELAERGMAFKDGPD